MLESNHTVFLPFIKKSVMYENLGKSEKYAAIRLAFITALSKIDFLAEIASTIQHNTQVRDRSGKFFTLYYFFMA